MRQEAPMAQNRLINLFSDTQTRPSPGMLKAMTDAELGDEQLGEDPTTKRLEERVADLLGKDAAVFMPSGTMCNQIAVAVHCRSGDEVLAADTAHLFFSEGGGSAVLANAQTWPIKADFGLFTGADLKAALRDPANRYQPRSRLVVMEQTANIGGGRIWPLAQIADVAKVARGAGMSVHMDGARLFNAVVASGISAKAYSAPFDSVWVDLSKGLGCPVGAVMAGSKDFITEAWRWKQRIGGAMRQSGIIAAAGLYALDHNIEKLSQDNANAKRLGADISAIPGLELAMPAVESNIVFFKVTKPGMTSAKLMAKLLEQQVRMSIFSGDRIRAVTHLDVNAAEIETAAKTLAAVMR
jgi:threonine aldolase